MATSSTITIKVAILTVLLPVGASAVTLQQSISLPMAFEYETNPRLVASDAESVSRKTLKPNYSLMATQANDQFTFDFGLNIERSSNQSASADREDPNIAFSWSREYETGQLGINANFSEQSTRFSEFDNTGIVTNNNTRKTRSLGGNWSTELNERYSLSVNLNLTKVTFNGLSSGLNDYDNKSINTQLTYSLNEQVDIFSRLSISRFEPINTSTTNFRSIDAGASWSLSENLSINADVGINETGGSNGTSGWQANIDTSYDTERSNSSAGLSRSRAPSGTGIIRESNRLSAAWTYTLSDKESVNVNYSYSENLGVNTNNTQQFSANYTRALAPSWNFSVSARYRDRDNNITNVSSNALTATITYNLSDF